MVSGAFYSRKKCDISKLIPRMLRNRSLKIKYPTVPKLDISVSFKLMCKYSVANFIKKVTLELKKRDLKSLS